MSARSQISPAWSHAARSWNNSDSGVEQRPSASAAGAVRDGSSYGPRRLRHMVLVPYIAVVAILRISDSSHAGEGACVRRTAYAIAIDASFASVR